MRTTSSLSESTSLGTGCAALSLSESTSLGTGCSLGAGASSSLLLDSFPEDTNSSSLSESSSTETGPSSTTKLRSSSAEDASALFWRFARFVFWRLARFLLAQFEVVFFTGDDLGTTGDEYLPLQREMVSHSAAT